jgi:hypothetical protein
VPWRWRRCEGRRPWADDRQSQAPLDGTLTATDPARFAQLKRDLAAVVSAEALFVLTDLAVLAPDDAIAGLVRTATTIMKAALE